MIVLFRANSFFPIKKITFSNKMIDIKLFNHNSLLKIKGIKVLNHFISRAKQNLTILPFYLTFVIQISFGLYAEKIPEYKDIDPILQATWDNTYPVSYSRITKKDTLGKGIMVLKEKNQLIYLYTFLVYFPVYVLEEEKLVAREEGGRDILVKLYYRPSDKEIPYKIDLGEFAEKYNLRAVVRWIK